MNAAVIKVAFANPRKPGKKQCTIKTDEGDIFGVWPDKFGLFQPGKAYRVEFSEHKHQGHTFKTITKCQPVEDNEPSPAGRSEPTRTDEFEFVTRVLSASIRACTVANSQEKLIAEIAMLRSVYRKAMV
jgi:hypothetical protein